MIRHQIQIRRNVEEGLAPAEGEPVLVSTDAGWILKIGDNVTPVEDLPVIAGPGAHAALSNSLLDGMVVKRITQADYDLLPTPRPDNVLYVVTP